MANKTRLRDLDWGEVISSIIGVVFYIGLFTIPFWSSIYDSIVPVTYDNCTTESIPFDTVYQGERGQYGYTESVVQQGVDGKVKTCKPSRSGHKDKVETIAQPVTHIIYRTPKPAPSPPPVLQPVYEGGGAVCRDGTRSYSTGRGTCSWHGGVDYWL